VPARLPRRPLRGCPARSAVQQRLLHASVSPRHTHKVPTEQTSTPPSSPCASARPRGALGAAALAAASGQTPGAAAELKIQKLKTVTTEVILILQQQVWKVQERTCSEHQLRAAEDGETSSETRAGGTSTLTRNQPPREASRSCVWCRASHQPSRQSGTICSFSGFGFVSSSPGQYPSARTRSSRPRTHGAPQPSNGAGTPGTAPRQAERQL